MPSNATEAAQAPGQVRFCPACGYHLPYDAKECPACAADREPKTTFWSRSRWHKAFVIFIALNIAIGTWAILAATEASPAGASMIGGAIFWSGILGYCFVRRNRGRWFLVGAISWIVAARTLAFAIQVIAA